MWTISLICHDYYPYRAGQYALVSVRNSAETLRAYTISSTPGVSEYITLTVRRIDDGVGSRWLTRDVKRGDYLWLSDAMGEFTCDDKAEDKFLLLAAGCGVTPIMSMSEYITLTVRRIDDGVGSQWLTRDVKRGDYLWRSDAMGEFTCDDKAEDKFLLLAAGCGVTPIMSMRRWLAKNRPHADVRVISNVRTPQDVIFADEWRNYPVTLVAENNVTEGFIAGRLTRELLAGVPDSDLASRTVMTCGPAPYMDWVEQEVKALGVTRFFKEKFFTPVAEAATSGLKFTKLQPAREFYAPVGTTLLEALESNSNNVPVVAACRAGVCGCCKTKVVSGEYTVSSTMTLTDAEIAEGYVLACSCHPQGDLVLA